LAQDDSSLPEFHHKGEHRGSMLAPTMEAETIGFAAARAKATGLAPKHPVVVELVSARESPTAARGSGEVPATPLSGTFVRVLSDKKKRATLAVQSVKNRLSHDSSRYMFSEEDVPWRDNIGKQIWSDFRIRLFRTTTSHRFEAGMGVVILFNMILIIYESDYRGRCYPRYHDNMAGCPDNPDQLKWLFVLNLMLLVLYSVEAATHMFIHRSKYLTHKWNVLDFFIVLAGWFSVLFEGKINISFLRIFRITRLLRAFRIVLSIRELYMLLTGLISSFKAIFFGTLLLLLMLVCWSIVLVEFVHPVNSLIDYGDCERCPRGFHSVMESSLTLFQTIIAGDSWGTLGLPVIDADPWTALIMVGIVLSVSLGCMNLILAVIVESAAEGRTKDRDQIAKQKEKEQQGTKAELLQICSEIDTDFSGSITLEEMQTAWTRHKDFRRIMTLLECNEDSLEMVFGWLDSDKSGSVDYQEFCDQLYALTTCDVRMMLAFNKFTMTEFEKFMRLKVVELAEKTEQHSSILKSLDEKLSQPWPAEGYTEDYAHDKGPNAQSSAFEGGDSPKHIQLSLDAGQGELYSADSVVLDVGDISKFDAKGMEYKTLASSDLPTELKSLQSRLEELAGLSVDIVRKADEQAATFLRHSQFLSSIQHVLPQAVAGERDIAWVSSHIGKLQRHVRERLAGIVQDLERKVDEEVGALASSAQLLEALAGGLASSEPAPSSHNLEAKAATIGPPRGGVTYHQLPSQSEQAAVAAAKMAARRQEPWCHCNGVEIPRRVQITK